jgi:hypothetical protein
LKKNAEILDGDYITDLSRLMMAIVLMLQSPAVGCSEDCSLHRADPKVHVDSRSAMAFTQPVITSSTTSQTANEPINSWTTAFKQRKQCKQ